MKKITVRFLLIVIAAAMLAPISSAQITGDFIEFVRTELERTNHILERVREVVRTSSSPPAALALEQAVRLQRQAWENFGMGTQEGYKFAAKLTQAAREQAHKALSIARLSEQGEETVLRKLERTKELLARVHESLSSSADESLRTLFESARRQLRQAWEFYRAREYRPALKLGNQVQKTVNRLLRIVNRHQNRQTNFERRVETVRELLSRVRERIGGCKSEAAERVFGQAEESFRKALELAENGRLEQAVNQLQRSRKIARQAAEMCGQADNISGRLESLKSEADRIKEDLPANDETSSRLIGQVYGQLENAREFILRQDNEAAAAALKAAQLTLRQLKRHLDRSGL
ncbi:MAG: hypothetical protein V3S17_08935 [candidate division Zixibacteria bacterium]